MNRKNFSAKPGIPSHPILLAICISSALSLSALVAVAQEATGISGNTSASTELRQYNIPAQPLSEALIEFGKQSGLQITASSVLVEGKQAPSVNGTLSAEQALNQLLAGNNLRYEVNGGMVRLAAGTETTTLPSVRVTVQGLSDMADLPPAYAGGQVARGGRIGLLGNRDIFDTPFSVTSHTAELIENQQARALADVIQNDSSAYSIGPRYGFAEFIAIRGFLSEILYDGLPTPGLEGTSVNSVRTLERVEIFKGPNALLNGTVASVGGTINLVPKRPTEPPLTRLTADYDYKSRLGIHTDLSRRFGSKKQFGARLNTIYHKGESAIENNEEEWGQVALALQYRTDKLRLETILDYSNRHADAANQFFSLDREITSVPSAPDLEDAIQQPWERMETQFTRAFLRAEYSLDKTWTMHAAYGAVDLKWDWLRSSSRKLNANGNFDVSFSQQMTTEKTYVWNAGIRGQFKTGGITHQIAVETVRSERDSSFAIRRFRMIPNFASNLYRPRFIARPQFDRLTRNPPKTNDDILFTDDYVYSSIAIADTMGFFDERVLLTAGIRRQTINNKFNMGMFTSKYDKSANTPAIGLVVKPWSFMSIYGNYIEALEPGPTAPRTAANAGEVFPPNETEQIEFGMKFDLDGLGLTAGVFQIERPNGITDENRRFSVDGERRNRGLELNAFGELRPDLRLLGGITYINSELTRTQGGRFDGNDAAGVPELAAVLNLEWDASFLSGLTLTARAEHRDSKYVRIDNSLKIPSYELYAIGARYKQSIGDKQFTFRMNIDNLLNKDYWNTFIRDGALRRGTLYLGSPRRINLSMSMDF